MKLRRVSLSLVGFLAASAIFSALPRVAPLMEGLAGSQQGPQYNRVPILCFHDLNGRGRYSLSSATFRHFMRRLRDENVSVIPLAEVVDRQKNKKLLSRPAVAITVDDDYEGAVRIAAPILREFAYPATFFVYTGGIHTDPAEGMAWDDLNRLLKEGFDVQNHSHTHTAFHVPRAGETPAAYERRLSIEIEESRTILEKNLMGHKIRFFAYPMGYHNAALRSRVFQAGYELVVTTDARPVDLTKPFTGSFDRRTIELEGNVAELIFEQALQIAKKAN